MFLYHVIFILYQLFYYLAQGLSLNLLKNHHIVVSFDGGVKQFHNNKYAGGGFTIDHHSMRYDEKSSLSNLTAIIVHSVIPLAECSIYFGRFDISSLQAEFETLLECLYCLSHCVDASFLSTNHLDSITILGDSDNVIHCINNKHSHFDDPIVMTYYSKCLSYLEKYPLSLLNITHIPRADNARADRLATRAILNRRSVLWTRPSPTTRYTDNGNTYEHDSASGQHGLLFIHANYSVLPTHLYSALGRLELRIAVRLHEGNRTAIYYPFRALGDHLSKLNTASKKKSPVNTKPLAMPLEELYDVELPSVLPALGSEHNTEPIVYIELIDPLSHYHSAPAYIHILAPYSSSLDTTASQCSGDAVIDKPQHYYIHHKNTSISISLLPLIFTANTSDLPPLPFPINYLPYTPSDVSTTLNRLIASRFSTDSMPLSPSALEFALLKEASVVCIIIAMHDFIQETLYVLYMFMYR